MTLTERITQLEAELQRCQQLVQHWTTIQLRTEGALIVLRQMKEEDEKANSNPAPAVPAGGEQPVG